MRPFAAVWVRLMREGIAAGRTDVAVLGRELFADLQIPVGQSVRFLHADFRLTVALPLQQGPVVDEHRRLRGSCVVQRLAQRIDTIVMRR